jgi:hypothetical protein
MGTKTIGGIALFFVGSVAVLVWAVLWGAAPAKTTSAQAAVAHEHPTGHDEDHHHLLGSHAGEADEHVEMPAGVGSGSSAAERKLYLTPGGLYTAADIRANGPLLPSEKFKGMFASHNMHPRRGDSICPITRTLANPKFAWIVGGKKYLFCCPPCVDEFVRLAKKKPAAVRGPEVYVKR